MNNLESLIPGYSLKELIRKRDISLTAIKRFSGDIKELESALGMLMLGYHYGLAALYTIHSASTIQRYERILGIVAAEEFQTPSQDPQASNDLASGYPRRMQR